jgi:peptidoglycan hydrolase CwlO-like protein
MFLMKSERMHLYKKFEGRFMSMFNSALADYTLFKDTYNDNTRTQTLIQLEITEDLANMKNALAELNVQFDEVQETQATLEDKMEILTISGDKNCVEIDEHEAIIKNFEVLVPETF